MVSIKNGGTCSTLKREKQGLASNWCSPVCLRFRSQRTDVRQHRNGILPLTIFMLFLLGVTGA